MTTKRGANKHDIVKIQKYAAGNAVDNIPGLPAAKIAKLMNIHIDVVKNFMPDAKKDAKAAPAKTDK